MSSIPFAALAERSGFQSDPRYSGSPVSEAAPSEPVATAWDQGHAAGYAAACEAAQALADEDAAARARIDLSLARLNTDQTELLRQKLYATVEALCAAAIAPLALDQQALVVRVDRAAAMLARADDDKLLRLHPDDLKLVRGQLPDDLEVLEDPVLERGALRLETASGGVEDGPAHWRRAITEALAQC